MGRRGSLLRRKRGIGARDAGRFWSRSARGFWNLCQLAGATQLRQSTMKIDHDLRDTLEAACFQQITPQFLERQRAEGE